MKRRTYNSSGLEDLQNLTVDALPRWRVHSRLNGINFKEKKETLIQHLVKYARYSNHQTVSIRLTSIERILAKLLRELHEISLGESELALQARILRVHVRAANLELVVVQTCDVHVGEPRDRTCRTANAAADIENLHTRLEAHLRGEVVLVTRERSLESLALEEAREVEGVSPAEFVQACSAVVVSYERRTTKFAELVLLGKRNK